MENFLPQKTRGGRPHRHMTKRCAKWSPAGEQPAFVMFLFSEINPLNVFLAVTNHSQTTLGRGKLGEANRLNENQFAKFLSIMQARLSNDIAFLSFSVPAEPLVGPLGLQVELLNSSSASSSVPRACLRFSNIIRSYPADWPPVVDISWHNIHSSRSILWFPLVSVCYRCVRAPRVKGGCFVTLECRFF